MPIKTYVNKQKKKNLLDSIFQCLKEIYRVLKPDGLFSMIEIDGTSNVYKDKEMDGSTFMYGVSLSHCLPVGMNSEGKHYLSTCVNCNNIHPFTIFFLIFIIENSSSEYLTSGRGLKLKLSQCREPRQYWNINKAKQFQQAIYCIYRYHC